ncbi:hypothetical protein [Dyella japonica]|uniref:Lipoprotein n=1 Tax=Dyella japonica TaxID=231455 RepID=A0ABV2JSH2_9GAMM
MRKTSIAALAMLATAAHAAEPKCASQTINGHVSELCVTSAPFQHDYYALKVDRALIFVLPDDYVEDITLTHAMPVDAAIEFPLSIQGTPTVKITGGCTPVTEKQQLNGKTIHVETGRSCSFKWGNVDILNALKVTSE